MFTYYPAHTTAAQPELVNAIAQGKVRISGEILLG